MTICTKKKLKRQEKNEQKRNVNKTPESPNSKVNNLTKNVGIPAEIRKQLLFSQALALQLKENAEYLQNDTKEREVFQKCMSGRQGSKKIQSISHGYNIYTKEGKKQQVSLEIKCQSS